MKKYLSLLFGVLGFSALAQNPCSSGRYYSEVFPNTQSTSGIKFGEADPYGLFSTQDLYLDIIEPVGDTLSKRPLILHQFGGGFLIGWRTEPVIPQMAAMYAKRGFVFATIDYRLGFNPLSGQSAERAVYRATQDLRASLRFLVDNADLYGIDTSAIFITGTSAGCLASFVSAFMNESDRADIPSTYGYTLEPADLGCIDCSGNNNFNNQEVRVHGIINNWGAMLDTSYIDIASDPSDNVPVISFHGTNDIIVPYAQGSPFSLPIFPTVQGSLLIHQRLDNQGIKNRLFPLQGLGHEPQLLQLQTWVTDTIIRQGSKFLYEIMYGDSIQIAGDNTVCLNDTLNYFLPAKEGSQYCWDFSGGTMVQLDSNYISIVWDTLGSHMLSGYELDKREISKEATLSVQVNTPPIPFIEFFSLDGLFTFSSTSAANTFSWNFGNGNQGIGNPITEQYTDTGLFLLSLMIEDDFCSNSKDSLIASTLCPVAEIQVIQNDSSLLFLNTSDFGDSNTWILEDGSLAYGDTLSLSFSQEGSYSIGLISANNYCSDTLTQIVPINFCSLADYSYQSNQLSVDFTEQAFNAFFYAWDFGDGNSSALPNPTHTYSQPDIYAVRLITTTASSCADTIIKQVNVDLNSSISTIALDSVQIVPNPAKNEVSINGINLEYGLEFELFSIDGKPIIKTKIYNPYVILPQMADGVYLIKLGSQSQIDISKIIIKH